MTMTLILGRRSRAVLLAWAFVPGAAAAPFVFWQSRAAGALFCLAWAAVLAGVGGWAVSFAAALDAAGRLTVCCGILWPTERTLRPGAAVGTRLLATPLLRLARCRLVLIYTAGGTLVLPAVDVAGAQALCAALAGKADP